MNPPKKSSSPSPRRVFRTESVKNYPGMGTAQVGAGRGGLVPGWSRHNNRAKARSKMSRQRSIQFNCRAVVRM
jgi:hypothetical protein